MLAILGRVIVGAMLIVMAALGWKNRKGIMEDLKFMLCPELDEVARNKEIIERMGGYR